MARPLITRLAELPVKAVEAARATVLPIHPLQIDVLKLIACICMLIDHINTCLFDRASVWAWLIGRLAFPLFGLTFVLTLKPHKAMATARRLLIWAICTQPVYALAFANTGFSPWWAGNILFSFAGAAYFAGLSRVPSAGNAARGALVFAVLAVIQAPSSFGMAGLVYLMALEHVIHGLYGAVILWVIVAITALLSFETVVIFVLFVQLLYLSCLVYSSRRIRQYKTMWISNRRWTAAFYLIHLGVLALL